MLHVGNCVLTTKELKPNRMKYYGITDKGKLRKTNQDNYVIATNNNGDIFAIICDGIGGGKGGDVASSMAVSYFSVAFANTGEFINDNHVREWLKENITAANHEIFQAGLDKASLKGMGTTLCGVLIASCGTYVVNIGDSRCYAYNKDGAFQLITMDHTLVNDMLIHGEITKKQADNYPQKNVLTNALGVWDTVRYDLNVHHEHVDGFLLCSDGLHGYVDLETIEEIVLDTKNDPSRRARRLLKAALDAGGYDNITAILIDVEEGE